MTPPDNEQSNSQSRGNELERTLTLMRCEKHGLTYLENESCPECDKEKDGAGSEGK